MTAIVFCLACEKVMNLSEYMHPVHRCTRLEKKQAKPVALPLFDTTDEDES